MAQQRHGSSFEAINIRRGDEKKWTAQDIDEIRLEINLLEKWGWIIERQSALAQLLGPFDYFGLREETKCQMMSFFLFFGRVEKVESNRYGHVWLNVLNLSNVYRLWSAIE